MQTSVTEKQYQKSNNAFEINKKEEVKTKSKRNHIKPNLVYDKYFNFYKYHHIKEFNTRSPDLKMI